MLLLPVVIFLCFCGGDGNPLYSVYPSTVGVGSPYSPSVLSTIPGVVGQQVLTTTPTLSQYSQSQSPFVQLLRQPGVVGVDGSLGLNQLVTRQNTLLNGFGGVVPLSLSGAVHPTVNDFGGVVPLGLSGAVHPTVNNYGLATTTLPNGLTLANVNGVPVLVQSGLGLHNGFQTATTTLPQIGASPLLNQQLIQQQPLVGVSPVVRDVGVDVVAETPASLVQMDSMDAALLDMENKGQMHMEKYAWGRSNLNKQSLENARQLLADVPRVYAPLPAGGVVTSPQPLDILNQNRVGTRNPFVDSNGKRKKHFELYQYFRNLNDNQPQTLIPFAVLPPASGNE